ncbi:Stromal interaction molecule 2 [Triplophysa tibetana]|uniref:Stromal interaction molecule 2 n=1 Tax=Triplophysa tibetana TaxID=1572043 RepID=A0A5A9PMV2_9TELE|nr:Stromal interaction molecule 2 [Triplophysa tibetana]
MLIFCLTALLVLRGLVSCDTSSDEPHYTGLYKDATVTTTGIKTNKAVFKDNYNNNKEYKTLLFLSEENAALPFNPCLQVSPPCMTEADRFSMEALQHIHREMDDDQDGGIEVEESVEFIIEDMQQQQQANKHSKLHQEDQHITLEELWRSWKSSEVHNWTQENVLSWLREFVELPQYEKNFKELRFNGNTLPRIAANEPSFMSTHLKIHDQQHKQKLKLKALDVVLFGPPTRPPHNWMKDLILIVSVVMGIGGCLFAKTQNKTSKEHISKMMKDLESLQRAEQSLTDLQEQLEKAQEEKRTVVVEKKNLEEKMKDEIQGAQEEANRLHKLRAGAVSELSRLWYAEEELDQMRGALMRAEKDMQFLWSIPESLQLWLQLTHEVELQYYNVKKHSAEQQLNTAKEEVVQRYSNLMLMPRAAMKSYQVPMAVEDMEEEMSQIIPQIPVSVAPLKCSPRSLVRSRRSGHMVPSSVIVSPDPDLLIPIRSPLRRYGDEDEEHIKFSPLVKQESMDTSSDTESIGSSISRMYTGLDAPPRRKYREGFSEKMSRRISLEEQEDIPSRKISQEEMDESMMITSRKVSREELDTNTPLRKTSREELETTVDFPKELTGRADPESIVSSRKLPRDLSIDFYSTEKLYSPTTSINIDPRQQRSFRERKDQMGDSICRAIPKSDVDTDVTSANRYSDVLMSASMKQRDNLDFSNIQRGRMFRENSFDSAYESSIESSKKFKMFARTDPAKDIPPRMMPEDDFDVFPEILGKDISMNAALRKMTGEEFDTSIENQRGRSFKESRDVHMQTQRVQRSTKIDYPVDLPVGKIQREVLGLSTEAVTNPGPPEPPDLTVSSLMVLKPASETLSTLVYDGILEKSYENAVTPAAGDLGYGAGFSGSSQSLLGYEGSSASLSSWESSSKDKGKKSSMLKNLFKKKKEKEKE